MVEYIIANNQKWTGNNNQSVINKTIASTINTGEGSRRCDASNYICDDLPENFNLKQVGQMYGTVTAIVGNEKEVINPLKNKTPYGWHFEQNVYEENGLIRAIKASNGSGNIPKVIKKLRIRKLTPKECWRLMGFTDDLFDKAEKVNSNAQLYKQAGNSIVVTVLMNIFKQLLEGGR